MAVAVEVAAALQEDGEDGPQQRPSRKGSSGSAGSFSSKRAASFRYKQHLQLRTHQERPPWEGDDGSVTWPQSRIRLYQTTRTQNYELAMGAIIFFNLILVIIEVDNEASCYPLEPGTTIQDCETRRGSLLWLWLLELLCLLVYTGEMALKMYVDQFDFFRSGWNNLDFVVVVSGWLGEFVKDLDGMSFLRFLRTARLIRMMRALSSFRELYLLVNGIVNVIKTLVFSSLMLFAIITMWSVIMVEHVHPVNIGLADLYDGCTRCPRAFSSVMTSNLTIFQQIVTGDSWGTVSIPVIEAEPVTAVFFIGIVVTVSLGLMNLILAVIVERATDAREADQERKLREKEKAEAEQKLEMFHYCQQIDTDDSGEICLDEIIDAYDRLTGFRKLLNQLDVQKEDLSNVFKLLDTDRSGAVSYGEFIDELHNIRTRDTRTMLTFLKLAIHELHEKVTDTDNTVHTLEALQKKADTTEGTLADIQQKLEAALPQKPDAEAPAQSAKRRAGMQGEEGRSLLRVLGQDARELASIKNGIVARVEAQVETLLQHSDWLGTMSSTRPVPEDPKVQRMEEKMGRLRFNMDDVQNQLEQSAAALARNTELLAGLSKEMDYQPKAKAGAAQSASRFGMPSPRVGHPPQKPVQRNGDQLQAAPQVNARRPSASSAEEPLTCKCTGIEKGPRAQIAARAVPPDVAMTDGKPRSGSAAPDHLMHLTWSAPGR